MSSWLIIHDGIEWIIRLGMIPVIIRRRFPPGTSMAWLSIIFFLPIAGFVVYLLAGHYRLGRRRMRLHRLFLKSMREYHKSPHIAQQIARPAVDPLLLPLILQAEKISRMPIIGGSSVELLGDTQQMVRRLIADIDAAEHHVHMLFYIYRPDATGRQVADALIRAAQRGVRCRLLADAAGSRQLFHFRGLAKELNEQGVLTHPALPAAPLRRRFSRIDLRNHRKLVVIDGQVAYTGSQNIVDADYGNRRSGPWIDLSGRFTGPVVGQFQAVFLDDWGFETKGMPDGSDIFPTLPATGDVAAQVVATGPNHESISLLRVILASINAAQKRIVITSPYLVPDEPTIQALSMAVDRGVRVDVVVPLKSDHPLVSAAGRAHFIRLLEAGVHIYQHSAGMLHAKTITVDDTFALLGSSNLDIRSFHLNFELNVLLYGARITQELQAAQEEYMRQSEAVNPRRWRHRSGSVQFLENAAALLSPLL